VHRVYQHHASQQSHRPATPQKLCAPGFPTCHQHEGYPAADNGCEAAGRWLLALTPSTSQATVQHMPGAAPKPTASGDLQMMGRPYVASGKPFWLHTAAAVWCNGVWQHHVLTQPTPCQPSTSSLPQVVHYHVVTQQWQETTQADNCCGAARKWHFAASSSTASITCYRLPPPP
jgi:hypothetical protein